MRGLLSGSLLALVALALAIPELARAAPEAPPPDVTMHTDVTVHVSGLRSHKGQVLACLTTNPRAFPDCGKDAGAHRLAVPAAQAGTIAFGPVPAGTYAIALVHDENGNGRMDLAVMLPKEGFAFSRDPAIVFGPPRFASAAFAVAGAPVQQTVRMRYMF